MIKARIVSIILILTLIISGFGLILNFGATEQPLAGSTLYVGPTSIYKTIQSAVDNASSGDTIIVENGTYIESIEINKTLTLIGNSSTDCKIYHYSNSTNRFSSYSAAINISANWVNITGFNITTAGNFTHGITLRPGVSNSHIDNNEIFALGRQCIGIMFYYSGNNNNISNNIIKTYQGYGFNIYIYYSDYNMIYNNNLSTDGQNADSILIGDSDGNVVDLNQIHNTHSSAEGITINSFSLNNIIKNNNIGGPGHYGIRLVSSSNNLIHSNDIKDRLTDGLHLEANSNSNNLTFNKIETGSNYGIAIYNGQLNNLRNNRLYNNSDQAIYLSGSTNNNLFSNIIYSSTFLDHGIHLNSGSSNNVLDNNYINIIGDSGVGIFIVQLSDDNTISDNVIKTSGLSSYGIQIDNANNNEIIQCDISTTGTTSPGIYLDGNRAVAINTTVTTGAASNDLVAINDGNLTVINCSFTTVFSTSGVIQVKNFLDVQMFYEDGSTPIVDGEVQIKDNGFTIYATSGYGGVEPKTDAAGRLADIIVPDRWYFYSNTATENITNLSVKKTVDRTWETYRLVDMATSHTEEFTAVDIVAPPIPTGINVVQVGPNSLKITWDIMPDTVNYTVYSTACQNSILRNVTHPQNWTIQDNLDDESYYYYQLQAWDKVGLNSSLSPVEDGEGFVKDITPPTIPSGLAAIPVSGGDALNISWNLNLDDTINYKVFWNSTTILDWVEVFNITHPNAWYIWTNESLVDGSEYEFKIQAQDKKYNPSNISSSIFTTHIDYVPPEPVSNFNAKAILENAINLSWNPSPTPDVEKYEIYLNQTGANATGPFKLIGEVDSSTYQFQATGLNEYTKYYFKVLALDEASNPSVDTIGTETTLSTPPSIPILNPLPEYTNNPMLNITGFCDPNVEILIFRNNVQEAKTSTNASGYFVIELELAIGANYIKVRAMDQASLLSINFSGTERVILDIENPEADAGSDMEFDLGQIVEFDGSESSDNYEIINYTWTFEEDDQMVALYGKKPSFKFTTFGSYDVSLTVIDIAGNQDTDGLVVVIKLVTEPEKPKVLESNPIDNSTDISVETDIKIKFSLRMNITAVADALDISPEVEYNASWEDANKILIITFINDLDYETTYTLTITDEALGINDAKLAEAPFILVLTTEEEPMVVEPVVEISSPTPNSEFSAGETITVSGTSINLIEGTEVMVIIGGLGGTGKVKADGTWEVNVMTPDAAGTYDIEINAGGWSDVIPVIIKQSEKPGDGGDDGDGSDDTDLMGLVIPIIIIVIIVIIILMLLLRRKKSVEEASEEGELEEETEGEEEISREVGLGVTAKSAETSPPAYTSEQETDTGTATEETYECPDCGAELGADDTTCSSCGAEFEDDEEDEDEDSEEDTEEESEEGDEDDEGFECPDCGADLGDEDTVCSSCGAEFED
jgi:parallel beta-helix repeat protein